MADGAESEDQVDLEDDNYIEEMDDFAEEQIEEEGPEGGIDEYGEDQLEDFRSEDSGKDQFLELDRGEPDRFQVSTEPLEDEENPAAPSDEDEKDKHAELLALPPRGSEVFIGGLPRDVTEEDLTDLCDTIGDIFEIRLVRNRDSGESKGFAFVAFKTKEVAQQAIEELHNKEFKGRTLRCSLSETKHRLFIGNVPKIWTDDDFRKIIERTGPGAENKNSANHLMKWIGIQVDFDLKEMECTTRPSNIPENILRSINFTALEDTLNIKFNDRSLLVEAITHASRPSPGVSCYQRLEFVGDAVLDHLITRHLFFTYTDLPPGRLTDLRAAAVNNENFARVAVKHKLHLHLRHGSSALEKQIRDFVREVQDELSKPGFNSFGLGDCKAPKVLGDIVESIAGAIFLDGGCDTAVVWKVFQPLLHPMVTPETLPMHPVRELQERCQQQAEGLEYKAIRNGNLATVEVFIDGVQVGIAQNPQKKMAQKLAARNALVTIREREAAVAEEKNGEDDRKKKFGSQTFTRQTLNDICLRRNWPMPLYRCVNEGGPAHAKRFTFAVRVNTTDRGWTDECVGEPMPSVKKAKDSAAVLLLELLNKWYA